MPGAPRSARLKEQLVEAQAERDEAIRQRDEMDTEAQHRAARYAVEKREVVRELDEARAALLAFGRHRAACGALRMVERRGHHGEVVYGQCDCGLEKALKGGA